MELIQCVSVPGVRRQHAPCCKSFTARCPLFFLCPRANVSGSLYMVFHFLDTEQKIPTAKCISGFALHDRLHAHTHAGALLCDTSFCLTAGVYLWVLGQADMSWSDTPGGRRTNFDYEIYLKDCMTMWGKGECTPEVFRESKWAAGDTYEVLSFNSWNLHVLPPRRLL